MLADLGRDGLSLFHYVWDFSLGSLERLGGCEQLGWKIHSSLTISSLTYLASWQVWLEGWAQLGL